MSTQDRALLMRYVWTTIDETHEGVVSCLSEALEVFRRAQQHPGPVSPMVMYWDDDGRELGIGAGREFSVATFQVSVDPPYFVSQGSAVDTSLDFIFGNEPTEYPAEGIFPAGVAPQLIAEFFASANLPKSVRWSEV